VNKYKLNFESENLVVDWISFKFQELEGDEQMKIIDHLFRFQFNSYQESGRLAKPIREPVRFSSTNKFEVLFVKEGPYWNGTTLRFSGVNSRAFYNLIQKNLIDWTLFSSAVLSRFDIYYSRKNIKSDKVLITDFLDNSYKKLKQTNKNVSLEKNSKGLILKIGSRRSNNYSRIYEGKNFLKFEQEMKGKFIQNYHFLLVDNSLEMFEEKLSFHFLFYFGKLLPLQYSYLDWLVIKLRPIRKKLTSPFNLNSDYISSKLCMNTQAFVLLLQFLNYAQDLDFKIEYLGGIPYREVTFKLQDFLKFQNPLVKSSNHYQLDKIKIFFYELQSGAFLTSFTDVSFQSLATIPQVRLEKCPRRKFWIVRVWLVNDLFHYKYPFSLPNFFRKKLTKHELEVAVKFIKVFNSPSIQKDFYIEEFFGTYPSILSNQQKTKMKRSFVRLVEIIQEADLIKSNYEIIYNDVFFKTEKLTITNISQGFRIYEKLSL
jgi:hypothetical protein